MPFSGKEYNTPESFRAVILALCGASPTQDAVEAVERLVKERDMLESERRRLTALLYAHPVKSFVTQYEKERDAANNLRELLAQALRDYDREKKDANHWKEQYILRLEERAKAENERDAIKKDRDEWKDLFHQFLFKD